MRRTIVNYDEASFKKFIKRIGPIVTFLDTKHWGDHGLNVSCLSFSLAEAIGLPLRTCDRIGFAALAHDLGKLDPRLQWLFAPEKGKKKFTAEEKKLCAEHAAAGYKLYSDMLDSARQVGMERIKARVEDLFDQETRRLVHDCQIYHDVPFSEGGETIPLVGRICRIADAFDAMVVKKHPGRGYQKPRTPEEAKEELLRCSGTDFDPKLVKVFIQKVLVPRRSPSGSGSGRKKKSQPTVVVRGSFRPSKNAAPIPVC
ncbi:MAG: HD domain-containing protein [Candidatus Doudnabacteria bacterium]|nr:HD domain-containing protein [Candidatus Doudnabacteria bacterium]